MLKTYKKIFRTLYKDEIIYETSEISIESYVPKNERFKVIDFSWEKMPDIWKSIKDIFPFCYSKKKKGYTLIDFLENIRFCSWKDSLDGLKLEIATIDYTPSIKELIEYKNGDLALEYITERQAITKKKLKEYKEN